MSSIQEIVVCDREELGKGPTGRLRRDGRLPAVVYGLDGESKALSAEPKTINKVLHSEKGYNSVLNLRLEGTEDTRHVMIKSVDRHPVSGRLVHVDFLRIDMDKKVTTVIPIEVQGTPSGAKLGGILSIIRHEIEVTCLPKDIPAVLNVDISHLEIDDALRVRDLPEIDGVEYGLGPKRTIAIVQPPDAGEAVTDDEEDDDSDVDAA